MSKRVFPQQNGERKKAKLNITISDHNFPLSQNAAANDDNWGDDNDDEILLMASQACEQAYSNNSTLPDFSLCMQPGATSTQMFPQPGPSKEFNFRKPSTNSPYLASTHLKDKCNRISSPLPGISSKVISNGETMKYNDDFIYNDKVYKGQEPDHVYRQLLQLQEANAKLKSENGKLLDKCVTKEGEASILRTQLKSCQVAVDNARMEKIKAQEKVQMEWTDKLSTVTGQMHDLRTQLDFKNLEIISIKERCRMLESSKVKLTQVTVPNNDISSSHRHNNMSSSHNLSQTQRRVKMLSSSAQTDSKSQMLKLYKSHSIMTPNLTSILPAILEPTSEQPSLLDNEKLRSDLDQSQHPCKVFSTFHRVPASPVTRQRLPEISIGNIHEDLAFIADGVDVVDRFDKIVQTTCCVLGQVQQQLVAARGRSGAGFRRAMDERYVTSGAQYSPLPPESLLSGRVLFKDEQGILARRMVATVALLLDPARGVVPVEHAPRITDNVNGIIPVVSDVCALLDTTYCATLYNGLLYSVTLLLEALPSPPGPLVWCVVSCRPPPTVVCRLLRVLRKMAAMDGFQMCAGGGNLRVDFEQGVLLYKKESCHLHVFLKQVEVALRCVESQRVAGAALGAARQLLGLHANCGASPHHHSRCDCQLVLVQVLVSALRVCAVMLNERQDTDGRYRSGLLAVCRQGALALQRWLARGGAPGAGGAGGAGEGAAQDLTHLLRDHTHPELTENMLIELAGTFQCAADDAPPSYHRQAWVKSFDAFSMAD